jgi:hypothetical protein
MPDVNTINNLFQQVINQFQEPIYNRIFRTNPYMTLVPRAEFTEMDGLQPQVVTSTSDLPTSYPTNLANLTLSNGTSDSCDVTPGTIVDGNIVRNYQLEKDAWDTRTFCLTDLQFDWQAAQMIRNLQLNIGQFATVRWSDWYRIKNLCMINGKVATISNSAFDMVEDSNCDFSGLTIGSSLANLEWTHLNDLYDMQIRAGAGEYAVGYSEGQPLFALAMGPGQKRYLFQQDSQVRETVNWGDAFQNFTARGINTSINGFIPNVDEFPLRYDENMDLIYPTRNVAATKGQKWESNPAYKTVANGGDAVFEVVWIMPRSIWEARVRPVGTTAFGMASFNPINYVGDLQWINNKTFGGVNDQGNKGYYRIDLQMAAKPIFPEFGYSIITAARD